MLIVCGGRGTQRATQTIKRKIPAGVDDGATIRLREHGEAIAGGPKGDLCVHIRVRAHKQFTREGDLILSQEHIDMVTAALGGGNPRRNTVDGPVTMKVPAGTQSGRTFKLSGHGAPHIRSGQRGRKSLLLWWTPVKLSREQQKLLRAFRAASPAKRLLVPDFKRYNH